MSIAHIRGTTIPKFFVNCIAPLIKQRKIGVDFPGTAAFLMTYIIVERPAYDALARRGLAFDDE